MQYGSYNINLDINYYKELAREAFLSDKIKYTGKFNLNYFVDTPKDVNEHIGNYFSNTLGLGKFDWKFQYFHSGEPAGLHTDFTTVPWDDTTDCRVDVGVIIPLEWNCKQPYTINYDRVEHKPRKAIYKDGNMKYTDNGEIINYRHTENLDEEVAKYNPKGTWYHRLYFDLKVESVYEWKLGTAMVFDTARWHSSSWYLSSKELLETSTEYKRAIIGFGSTDIPKGDLSAKRY